MAKISGQASTRFIENGFIDAQSAWTNDTPFGNYAIGRDWVDANNNGSPDANEIIPNPKGQDSTVYKLMNWAKQRWTEVGGTLNPQTPVSPDAPAVQPTYFKEKYFSGVTTPTLQYGGIIPIVALYEIDWDAYHNATSTTG